MHKPEVKIHNNILYCKDIDVSSSVVNPSADFTIDDNNNETPEHKFGTGKKYDSGLGILSPQSDISLTNIFPNKHEENGYSTLDLPVAPHVEIKPEKKWNSLFTKIDDSPRKANVSNNAVFELKTLDSNNNMSTSIVFYRKDNRELRHINIIDYRAKYKPKVRRSNTFSNDKNDKHKSSPKREMWRSTDNLTFAQNSLSTNDLCDDLSRDSSLSENISQVPRNNESHQKIPQKSNSKIIHKIISTLCCRKHLPPSEPSDEEMETFENYPDWKFSLDEFDEITYFSSGAQGSIYTAILKEVKVALKKVKDNAKRDDIQIEHLLALNHQNIIKFIGVCVESPNYLVMEFCCQGQLFHWLHRDSEISPIEVCSWAYQICDGMSYLHRNDIIHRDLKSPNILISVDNVLKIIDFEFSKDCCESKMMNSFVGTMAWMAPEVLREEVHTKKVDVWSYGIVLWEMITREIPYCGIERMSILFGVGNNCLSLPICNSIPVELKKLLSSCWEQCPDNRPQFQEILNNFYHYFDGIKCFSQEEFTNKQTEWKSEIETELQEITKEKISTSKVEAELIKRRTKELNDAKDIKELYNDKLRRADKLICLLNKCLNAVEDERKKNDCEWKLIQKFKQSIGTSVSNKSAEDTFLSLQVPNKVKNIKIRSDRTQKTVSPNTVGKRSRGVNRHSMLEPEKQVEKSTKVRRKHSVPIFKEKNYFPGTKAKVDFELSNKVKTNGKCRPKQTSVSLESVANDKKDGFSLRNGHLNNRLENGCTMNSSTCKHMGFSTLPSSNKTSDYGENAYGTINLSFQGSCDSFTNIKELKMTNSNLLQIACFGKSASISDLNQSQDSLNCVPNQKTFHHNLLAESITEHPYHEESQNMEEIHEDIQEYEENGVVIIRDTSGRSKSSIKRFSSEQSLKDSLDVSMLNYQSQTPYSLIEKEKKALGLIKPFDFLAHVNDEASLEIRPASINHDESHSNHLGGISQPSAGDINIK